MKRLIFKTGNTRLDTKIGNHFDKLVQVFGYSKARACSICQHLACTANGQSFYNLKYRLGENPRLP